MARVARVTRVHREQSGEVAKPPKKTWWKGVKERARGIIEAPERLSTRELAEAATGIFGAGILRQKAVRDITKGFLKHLAPEVGRKTALKAARPHIGATARLPQELLDLVESVQVKYLPKGIRARLTEVTKFEELRAAKFAKRSPVARRMDISLDPEQALPSSVYHEAGHIVQKTTKDPALARMLGPVTREYAEKVGVSPGRQSLTERHARDFASDILKKLQWERTGKKFSVRELDEIASWSLESILRKSGRTP